MYSTPARFFTFVYLLAACVCAGAVGAPIASAKDDHKTAAKELAAILVTPKVYQELLGQVMQGLAATGGIDETVGKKFAAALGEVFSIEELRELQGELYGSMFTTSELREMTAFYRTKVGKKLLDRMPLLGRQLTERMSPMLQARLPAALKRHGLIP